MATVLAETGGGGGDPSETKQSRTPKTPADFLSSVEVAIVERADVILMQNWAHLVAGE